MEADFTIPEEARRRYIERRHMDFESLSAAVRAGYFHEFKRIGHQLKGNAASFGYPELEKMAISLEQAGLTEDRQLAERELARFEAWLAEADKAITA